MILHGKKHIILDYNTFNAKNIMVMLMVVMEIMFIHEGKEKWKNGRKNDDDFYWDDSNTPSTMTETKSSRYIYIVANLKGGPKDKCNRISNNMNATIHNNNIEFSCCSNTTYGYHYAVNSTPYIGFLIYVEWRFTRTCVCECCCCNLMMFYDWRDCVMSVLGTTKHP